jgi:hypothetical protein
VCPVTLNNFTHHPQNVALLQWFTGKWDSIGGALSHPDDTVLVGTTDAQKTPLNVHCNPVSGQIRQTVREKAVCAGTPLFHFKAHHRTGSAKLSRRGKQLALLEQDTGREPVAKYAVEEDRIKGRQLRLTPPPGCQAARNTAFP